MKVQKLGVILNGATGRMGTNQHLMRALYAIRRQGGIKVGADEIILPEILLLGRNAEKLKKLSEATGGLPFSLDLDAALGDAEYSIYFDAQVTDRRADAIKRAIAAGKHIYCEKPSATNSADAMELYRLATAAGVKHGAVQDKLWLPGLLKLKNLIDAGFFGSMLSVRGEFGYWVFTGESTPLQRPSWNYRKKDGGSIILDMLCHFRYIVDNLFGEIKSISCLGATHIDRRWNEQGQPYAADADDAAYVMFVTESGIICNFNLSWCARVNRDELLELQVDGTQGSAVAGLRQCRTLALADTPRAMWNPDIDEPNRYRDAWTPVQSAVEYENAFKGQWELFLRHVALNEPFRWNLLEAAKGVQLSELGMQSWADRRWIDVPSLA